MKEQRGETLLEGCDDDNAMREGLQRVFLITADKNENIIYYIKTESLFFFFSPSSVTLMALPRTRPRA